MRRSFLLTAALLVLAITTLFTSCHYKDLCYDHHHDTDHNLILKLELKLELDVDLDVSEEAHTKITVPSHMVVCFYDTASNALKQVSYVESYGGPLQVAPGTYDMVVYSFDTEFTQVRNENNRNTLEAFTSDITSMKMPLFSMFEHNDSTSAPGPIIYTPDHLLVARERVEIPPYSMETQVITIETTAATVVKTYGFELTNVEGIEYVSSVDAFITNQARSTFFGRNEVNTDPATIYFPMEVNRDSMVIETTFNTFGKLPGESRSYLNIVVTDTEGKPYTLITDITDSFEDENHMIIIQDSIVVPAPTTGGGIDPTVEPWDEEKQDIQIG